MVIFCHFEIGFGRRKTNEKNKEVEDIKDKAVEPFNKPVFRTVLLEMSVKSRLVIDGLILM